MAELITLSDDEDDVIIEDVTVCGPSKAEKKRSSPLKLREEDEDSLSLDYLDKLIAKKRQSAYVPEPQKPSSSTEKTKFVENEEKSGPPKAKKRRTKEEIEKDKLEKEGKKIEREISVSVNSKCEQYTYCRVGNSLLEDYDSLRSELSRIFSDRKIPEQWSQDQIGNRIEWSRKVIQLNEDEGRFERSEHMVRQEVFAVILKSDVLKDVIRSKTLYDFVLEQKNNYQKGQSLMLIVSYGSLEMPKKDVHKLTMELFDLFNTQIIELASVSSLALLAAQFHRSIARRERKRIERAAVQSIARAKKVQYLGDKGATTGMRCQIVRDWWDKMLGTIDHLADSSRRAIVDKIPDPIVAVKRFSKMDHSQAVQEISDIVGDNGRRVGPAHAHRIVTMLTDVTGAVLLG